MTKKEITAGIEHLLEDLWQDGYEIGKSNKGKIWVLLPIGGNETVNCDCCYKAIQGQDLHICSGIGSKKVICEHCWDKKEVNK